MKTAQNNNKKVYMAVTLDDLELPIALEDTLIALAKVLKVSYEACRYNMARQNGIFHKDQMRIIKVLI